MAFNKGPALNALIGGIIMAIASSLHLLVRGKITGISGSFFKSIHCEEMYYNLSFLLGMILISAIYKSIFPSYSSIFFETSSSYLSDLSFLGFCISGFLVGYGTKLANGCTSGHGVCGLPRLSKRSIVAVITFCICGILFATFRYYVPFLVTDFLTEYIPVFDSAIITWISFIACIGGIAVIIVPLITKKKWSDLRDYIIALIIGMLFGYGLLQSGMVERHTVINFLTISKHWDYTLVIVLASAVGVNLITFYLILKYKSKPIYGTYSLPTKTKVDGKLLLGSAIFGIGWGMGGICPGPAVIASYVYLPYTAGFLGMMALGQYCAIWSEGFIDKHLGGNSGFALFKD